MDARGWMLVIVTMALLGGALYVILSGRYEDDTQKWAYGIVGAIMTYWLK